MLCRIYILLHHDVTRNSHDLKVFDGVTDIMEQESTGLCYNTLSGEYI